MNYDPFTSAGRRIFKRHVEVHAHVADTPDNMVALDDIKNVFDDDRKLNRPRAWSQSARRHCNAMAI